MTTLRRIAVLLLLAVAVEAGWWHRRERTKGGMRGRRGRGRGRHGQDSDSHTKEKDKDSHSHGRESRSREKGRRRGKGRKGCKGTEEPTTDPVVPTAVPTSVPATKVPTTTSPDTDVPTTDAPTVPTDVPATTTSPATDTPTTDVPAPIVPTTAAPTPSPATDVPTTDAPTVPTPSPATTAPATPLPCIELNTPATVGVFSPAGTTITPWAGTPVSEGMPGWTLGTTRVVLQAVPGVLMGHTAHFAPAAEADVTEGARLRVACARRCTDAPCEVIVVTYHCPPCSTATNGGLVDLLPDAGFTPGSCAPTFTTSQGTYPTTAFRTLVPSGSVATLPPLTRTLNNVGIFVRTAATDCEAQKDEALCTEECVWQEGSCVSNWCPGGGGDMAPSCQQCATA